MKTIIRSVICLLAINAWTISSSFGQAKLWDEAGDCDRTCLSDMADQYLDAVVANDPSAVPLSSNIHFTQNTEILSIGEGLWGNATAAPTTYKVYVPDPVARQIGFMGVMETSEGIIQIALRLKVENGEITEAEHHIAPTSESTMPNLITPRPGLTTTLPSSKRIPRELMLVIASSYYHAIVQSSGDSTLFADDCERRENGMITSGGDGPGFGGGPQQGCYDQMNSRGLSYITGIDLQRVWIADEVTGLVFAISQFRHAFETKDLEVFDQDGEVIIRNMDYEPFDFPAVHITKISDYKIHEQEAMGYTIPYMSSNGWNQFIR